MLRPALWVKVIVVAGVFGASLGISEVSAAARTTHRRTVQGGNAGGGNVGGQQQAINQVRAHASQLAAQEHARFVAKRRAAAIAKGNLPGGTGNTATAK